MADCEGKVSFVEVGMDRCRETESDTILFAIGRNADLAGTGFRCMSYEDDLCR